MKRAISDASLKPNAILNPLRSPAGLYDRTGKERNGKRSDLGFTYDYKCDRMSYRSQASICQCSSCNGYWKTITRHRWPSYKRSFVQKWRGLYAPTSQYKEWEHRYMQGWDLLARYYRLETWYVQISSAVWTTSAIGPMFKLASVARISVKLK